ncbi:hypothetical protein [Exiguobacterium sp. s193]|uniref:hypothetical protein n=1 Tax=Exiguobacterium sp. s193 TaxID=2751207 RepID=UPI001BE7207E|nr:hypothetical protein [Exiguobacterium sp. s193]
MTALFWIALVICIIGLIFTLMVGRSRNEESYSNKKMATNMVWMYLILLPIILIVLGVFYYLLTK